MKVNVKSSLFTGFIALFLAIGSFNPAAAETSDPESVNPETVEEDQAVEPQVPEEEDEVQEMPEEEEDAPLRSDDELELDAEPEELESVGPSMFGLQAHSTKGSEGLWGDVRNDRLSGSDRYETAVAISKDTFPQANTVESVVIATGEDFPDSLSAAPLAAKLNAPLLLTQTNTLTPVVKRETQRLKPKHIIIVGLQGAVSSNTEKQLKTLLPSGGKITRYGGKDRFETSLKVASAGWPSNHQNAFIATGLDFPDALSAAAAAGALDAPVILIPGNARQSPASINNHLNKRKVSTVHIVGGTGVVSSGIANKLKSIGSVKTVKRYSGNDRFATSAAVSNSVFKNTTHTYFAYALDFPDALTGAAAAGSIGAPLLLTNKTCIPSNIYDANDRLVPGRTTLLGGTGVLNAQVQHGNECLTRPKGSSAASWKGIGQLYAKINKARFDAGRQGFRVSDTKVGTPAYDWAKSKKYSRNASLAKQQPWVKTEAVARAPVATGSQVNYLFNMFIKDTQNGTRNAILRTYGGARGYISVGYFSASTGYGTLHIGTAP